MFGKKDSTKRILEEITEDNIRVIDVFKCNGSVFQLVCDVKRSEALRVGSNQFFGLFKLTQNGFVLIIDNHLLSIPGVSSADEQSVTLEKINTGFNKFKDYAREL